MPYLERPSARIYYEIEGLDSNPVLTLLNGYSRSSSDFKSLARAASEKGWRVIRLDNRGAGRTENEPGFTVSDMVGDVVALWDLLGVTKSSLLGISYGGVLSQLLASQHSQRIDALVLVSTTPSSFFLGIDNDLSSQNPWNVESSLSRYFSEGFKQANPLLYKSLLKETSKAFLDPQLKERAAQQRAALKTFDFTALLHSISAPTLILHGEEDGVTTPEAADVMHRAIKHSKLEIVPGIGHLFLAESPKLFSERVLAFLQSHH